MAEIKKINTEFQLLDKFLDTSGDAGTSGQVLSSTATGINWVSGSNLPGGPYLPLAGGTMIGDLKLNDNVDLYIGTGNDFQAYHDGSNTYLRNLNGSFVIKQDKVDADLILESDNGSGGTTPYLTLDGSTTHAYFSNPGNVGIGTTSPSAKLNVADGNILVSGGGVRQINVQSSDSEVRFGLKGNNGNQFRFVSDGTHIKLNDTNTERIKITNAGDTVFGGRDSGNNQATWMTLKDQTGNVGIGTTSPSYPLTVKSKTGNVGVAFFDSVDNWERIYIGGTNDYIERKGSEQRITFAAQGSSGLFTFQTSGSEKFRIANNGNVGIGTTSPGYKLQVNGTIAPEGNEVNNLGTSTNRFNQLWAKLIYDINNGRGLTNQVLTSTGSGGIAWANASTVIGGPYLPLAGGTMTGNTSHSDNVKDRYGTGNDFQIWHDGSNTFLSNEGEGHLNIINTGDDRDIIFKTDDGTGATTSYMVVDGSAEQTRFYKDTRHTDGVAAYFGDNNDLQISHDGSNSYIKESGTGNLRIRSTSLRLEGTDSSNMVVANQGDSVSLYYNTSKKFETSNGGVSVTGNGIFTGDVGIGTTSPTFKLHVDSADASDNVAYIHHNNAAQSSGDVLKVRSDAGDNAGSALLNVANNTGSALYVRGDRNVGIGTDSPQSGFKLDVNGNVITRGSAYVLTDLNHYGTNDFDIKASQGLTDIKFTAGGAERIRIKRQGNVGIGTTSPSELLELKPGSGGDAKISILKSDGSQKALIGYDDSNGGLINLYNEAGTTNVVVRGYGNSYFNGGNVGIGTTSPTNELEVLGGGSPRISLRTTSETVGEALELGFQVGTSANSSTNSVGIIKSVITQASPSALKGDMVFQTNSGDSVNTKMVIKDSGNVGIGTTAPSEKLEVVGYAKATTGFKVGSYGLIYESSNNLNIKNSAYYNTIFHTNNAERMRITNAGNVGIGTTSPSQKLHVSGVVQSDRFFVATNASADQWAVQVRNNASTADSGIYFNNNSSEIYLRNSSNVIGARIRSNSASYFNGGDVGIGIASPQERLHVSGETHPSIKLSSSSDGNYNVILNCGYRNEALNLSVGGYKVFTTEGFNTPETTHLYSNNSKALSLASNQAATFTSTVTATNFINSSDERLKENIEEVCNNNIEVSWKTFNFKTEKEQKRYGVIAQELEKTNPEFVREDSQGFKSVAYIDLLIAKIAELEARIQKLEK